ASTTWYHTIGRRSRRPAVARRYRRSSADHGDGLGSKVMRQAWLFVILAPVVVVAMFWSLTRNAIAMKRDIDQRFEGLRQRLEADATKLIGTLFRDRPGKNDSP